MTLLDPVDVSQVLARFRAIGVPMPAGSKVPFKDRAGNARLTESNAVVHAGWRRIVSEAAQSVAVELAAGPLDGALVLEVTFRFAMPKSRKASIRRQGQAPKITSPDTSKLVRSIEDSMQDAGLITDDARFATVFANKVEIWLETAHPENRWVGAEITIRRQT